MKALSSAKEIDSWRLANTVPFTASIVAGEPSVTLKCGTRRRSNKELFRASRVEVFQKFAPFASGGAGQVMMMLCGIMGAKSYQC